MAQSTWKTYKTAAESFNMFRSHYNLQEIWPVPLNDLIYYIAYLSLKGFSVSTVTTYISGISYLHKIRCLQDNTKSFLVTKTLEGLKRKKPKTSDPRVPISLDLLKRLIASLQYICPSVYESYLFSSAFSLCFFALLRVGEIASNSKCDAGIHVVRFKDVSFADYNGESELHLNLQSSKTDQFSSNTTLIIRAQKDDSFCPIRLLRKFLHIRSLSDASSNLFVHFDGSNLTRYQFSTVLKKALDFCEVKGHFRSHSFRIGGATEAKRLGVDDETIKIWGRWSSDAYTSYIRLFAL